MLHSTILKNNHQPDCCTDIIIFQERGRDLYLNTWRIHVIFLSNTFVQHQGRLCWQASHHGPLSNLLSLYKCFFSSFFWWLITTRLLLKWKQIISPKITIFSDEAEIWLNQIPQEELKNYFLPEFVYGEHYTHSLVPHTGITFSNGQPGLYFGPVHALIQHFSFSTSRGQDEKKKKKAP